MVTFTLFKLTGAWWFSLGGGAECHGSSLSCVVLSLNWVCELVLIDLRECLVPWQQVGLPCHSLALCNGRGVGGKPSWYGLISSEEYVRHADLEISDCGIFIQFKTGSVTFSDHPISTGISRGHSLYGELLWITSLLCYEALGGSTFFLFLWTHSDCVIKAGILLGAWIWQIWCLRTSSIFAAGMRWFSSGDCLTVLACGAEVKAAWDTLTTIQSGSISEILLLYGWSWSGKCS